MARKYTTSDLEYVNLINSFSLFSNATDYSTFFFQFIGIGIVAQFILSHEKLNTWIQVNIGWGFALALCVMLSAKTSGNAFFKRGNNSVVEKIMK